MTNPEQDEPPISENSASLSWPARFFFALFSGPAIGIVIGLLSAMNVTGVDGADGYAALYNGAIFTGLAFLALLFIGNKKFQIVLAVLAAVVWGVALFNI